MGCPTGKGHAGAAVKKLSILIPTLMEREKLLAPLLAALSLQIHEAGLQEEVEVLTFPDNRGATVGAKRNSLIDRATGQFVCFVDDDDEVADDYVYQLHEAIIRNPDIDCVGFRGILTRPGNAHQRQVVYSIHYPGPFESGGTYYRPPCHLTPIRRELAARYRYGDLSLGEDAKWSAQVAADKALKNECFVDKILYHYRFNPKTSGTQKNYTVPVPNPSPADLWKAVILSARGGNLKQCLDSLFANEPGLTRDRVIVVDDGALAQWDGSYPGIIWITGRKPFVYARNANLGITGAARDVILLNDDARLDSRFGFSSLAYAVQEQGTIAIAAAAVVGVAGGAGQAFQRRLAGMRHVPNVAFVAAYVTRAATARIGLLDEEFTGYGFDDNDYCLRAGKAGLGVVVYDGCKVLHDRPEASSFRSRPDWKDRMAANRALFEKKWGTEVLEKPKTPAPAADEISSDPNARKGMEHFLKEEWETAIPYFVAASKTATEPMDRSEFMLRAARCHASLGRLDVADNWFIGAMQETPGRREITFFYATALIRVRKLEDAIAMFRNCLSIPASARPFSIYDAAMAWDDKQVQEAIDFCTAEINIAKKRTEEANRAV